MKRNGNNSAATECNGLKMHRHAENITDNFLTFPWLGVTFETFVRHRQIPDRHCPMLQTGCGLV